jgi:hypothetical protein
MYKLTNSEFQNRLNELNVIIYTDMIAVEDEVGNVVEIDTTGNENHVNEETIFFDGVEYDLTESQKDKLHELAYSNINLKSA